MTKLTDKQKEIAKEVLHIDFNFLGELSESDANKIQNADWFIVNPGEIKYETTEEKFPFSLQAFFSQKESFDELGENQEWVEIDCMTYNAYVKIMFATK